MFRLGGFRISGLAILAAATVASAFADAPIYSNFPGSLPTDTSYSFPFDASYASEFGGAVTPDLTNGSYLSSATILLSNWAYESFYSSYIGQNGIDSTGYNVGLTLNIYGVNSTDGTVSGLMASSTATPHILWRPEPNSGEPGCLSSDGLADGYKVGQDPTCYGGQLQAVTFDFSSVALPGEFVFGLAFNTTNRGGISGPWDSLNFAMSMAPATIGHNPALDTTSAFADSAYVNTLSPDFSSIPGQFSQDWGYITLGLGSPIVEFDATNSPVPEPSTTGLIGLGLVAFSFAASRIRRRN